ncbi:MAG TPA: response regulator receiver protein [Terriglobia bacterium]|nr:response regulator receiver protein [Terriglobia bacterium]
MFFKEWEVLIVDDEPDIIQVSRLAMRHFEVYGLPLRLHTAKSKAEALQIFKNSPSLQPAIAVAFIDVVMETDTAGLDLCQALREEHGNRVTQLFIRTGQPGTAPERTVLDRYDINGYFTKVEATEDKLYSLVKSGVRQYLWNVVALGTSLILNNAIAAGESKAAIFETALKTFRGFHFIGDAPADTRSIQAGIFVGDQILGMRGLEPAEAQSLLKRLNSLEGKKLSSEGDSYVQDGKTLMIKVPVGPPGGIAFVANTTFAPPESVVILYHRVLRGLAMLLQRAK